VYAASAAILALKMIFVASLTAVKRIGARLYTNPEDARMFRGDVTVVEAPEVARIKRLHLNDLENIPIFLVLGLLFVIMGGSQEGAQAYFYTFVIARILHTVVYLAGLQPWRTLTWAVQVLVMIGLAVQILLHSFS
jgi:uncharacterized MAPEG superfamily protein